jgi:2C-methyl-D-erythritol 2,4-cyclodiphosphate synthase
MNFQSGQHQHTILNVWSKAVLGDKIIPSIDHFPKKKNQAKQDKNKELLQSVKAGFKPQFLYLHNMTYLIGPTLHLKKHKMIKKLIQIMYTEQIAMVCAEVRNQ